MKLKYSKNREFFFKIFSFANKFARSLVKQAIFNISPKIILEISLAIVLIVLTFQQFDFSNQSNLLGIIGYAIFRMIPPIARVVSNINTFSFHYASNKLLEDEFKNIKAIKIMK